MALRDYPSWIYDPRGIHPPQLVLNEAAFQAALAGTYASRSVRQAAAPVAIAVNMPVSAAPVVTQGVPFPPDPRGVVWTKTPSFDAQKR